MKTQTGASNQEEIGNRRVGGVSLRGISNKDNVSIAKTAVWTGGQLTAVADSRGTWWRHVSCTLSCRMDAVRYPGCGRRGLPLATPCSRRRRRRRLLDAVTLRTQRTVAVAERQRSDRRYLLVLVDLAGQRISTSGTRSRRRAAQSGPALACGVS